MLAARTEIPDAREPANDSIPSSPNRLKDLTLGSHTPARALVSGGVIVRQQAPWIEAWKSVQDNSSNFTCGQDLTVVAEHGLRNHVMIIHPHLDAAEGSFT